MKNYLTKFLVLVLMISCLNSLSVSANNNDAMMSAYLDVLNSLKDDSYWNISYTFYDIDKNGIAELIVDTGESEATRKIYFYTFSNGKCNFLGEISSSHSHLASIPDKNGVMRIQAHSSRQYAGIISITNAGIEENEIFYKYLTPEEYINHGYYTASELYEGSTELEFTDKNDLSKFGEFNYAESENVSTASYETGMKKGIGYYNEGLYYEAIDEIQWFCDANWYNMTEGQQNNALWYLNNAKSKLTNYVFEYAKNNYNDGRYYEVINEVQKYCDANWYNMTKEQQDNSLWYLRNSKTKLADYLFKSGKNYYNKGLYYEAKEALTNAIYYYTQLNNSNWKSANDYLYNTNNKIKHLESKDPKIHTYNSYNGKCSDCGTQLLYSGKGINIYYLGSAITYRGLNIYLKIDNNSRRTETIQVREESVNNYMADFIMSTDILPQKSAYTSIHLSSSSSPIALNDIHNVEFRFILCESDHYLTPRISLDL